MKHMWMHVVVIGLLLGGIVMLVNGIETALAQTARTAQVTMQYGAQPSTAVSSAVNNGCGVLEWLLPALVILVIVVAIVGVMLRSYCKHNGATR